MASVRVDTSGAPSVHAVYMDTNLSMETSAMRAVITAMGNWAMSVLMNHRSRHAVREKCSQRLQLERGCMVEYAEQAVLANLDWGLDGLECALMTLNGEARAARLEHSEKMLQVPALLDPKRSTAGIPNSYLSAWAHLYLAFVWKLRNKNVYTASHLLEMFLIDPTYARLDFAPELWDQLFVPHLTNIEVWYQEEYENIFKAAQETSNTPESRHIKKLKDGMTPASDLVPAPELNREQMLRLEVLNKLYMDCLDMNTQQYAQYYKDWTDYNASEAENGGEPSFPETQTPTTYQYESDDGNMHVIPLATLLEESADSCGDEKRSLNHTSDSTSRSFSFGEEHESPRKFVAVDDEDCKNQRVFSPVREEDGAEQHTLGDKEDISSLCLEEAEMPTGLSFHSEEVTEGQPQHRLKESRDTRLEKRQRFLNKILEHGQGMHPEKLEELLESVRNLGQHLPAERHSAPADREWGTFPISKLAKSAHTSSLADNLSGRLDARPLDEQALTDSNSDWTSSDREAKALDAFKPASSSPPVKSSTLHITAETLSATAGQQDQQHFKVCPSLSRSPDFITAPMEAGDSNSSDLSSEIVGDSQLLDVQRPPIVQPAAQDTSLVERDSKGLDRHPQVATDTPRGSDHQDGATSGSSFDDPSLETEGDLYLFTSNLSEEKQLRTAYLEAKVGATSNNLLARQAQKRQSQHDRATRISSMRSPVRTERTRNKSSRHEKSLSFSSRPKHASHQSLHTSPPKTFVCSITNDLFSDPVTLETGQTYERTAIQEWLDQGKLTCPITGQSLTSLTLPRTNFVLKRLVDTWKEEHLKSHEHSNLTSAASPAAVNRGGVGSRIYEASSPSPKRRLSHRFRHRRSPLSGTINNLSADTLEGFMGVLKPAVAAVCTAEELSECEVAVRQIVYIWMKTRGIPAVEATLCKVAVVEGLVDVLANSLDDGVLRATVCLLSELVLKDDMVRHAVMRADPSFEIILKLLHTGRVAQAAVLLYLLRSSAVELAETEVIPLLVLLLKGGETLEGGAFQIPLNPKAAAVLLLEQLVTTLDSSTNKEHAKLVVYLGALPFLIGRLESKVIEERSAAAKVLCCCMQVDGGCRSTVACTANLLPVVDMLQHCNGQCRRVSVAFFSELIRLNRREAIEKILQPVQREGLLDSMHVLMVDLQVAPLEERPLTASLLLQLDLLVEPRRHSLYREEAVEALVTSLSSEGNGLAQLEAAKVFVSLGGRFSYSGQSLVEAWLLETAGMEGRFERAMKDDYVTWFGDAGPNLEREENSAAEWDMRVSNAILVSHGRRVLEALGVALRSREPQVARLCLVATAWFVTLLAVLPDTGLQAVARNCCLPGMVNLIRNGKEVEEKVLASLSLNSFQSDPVGVQQIAKHSKDLIGPLRGLKPFTWTAKDLLNTLVNSPSMHSTPDLWAHGEVHLMDASLNGETRALLFARGLLYSAHMDGSIKVWDTRRQGPRLLKEVKAHMKSALCLAYHKSANQLYTGSADKTIRVWSLEGQGMKCLRSIDVKEPVLSLVVNSRLTCLLPQGSGIKLLDGSGTSRLLNCNKHVQSIHIVDDTIYCGCTDNSIQEIETTTGSMVSIQAGFRLLRGKRPIYAIQVYQDLLFTAGALVEGGGTKIWRRSTRAFVSAIPTQADVRAMAINDEFIYLASSLPGGTIEVWLRARLTKVATLTAGSKVTALTLVGESLYSGSEDGKIRAFALT